MGRYVVLGAGAVGGTIGGRLHQAGHDVTLIARGTHGEAIRRAGLLLRDPTDDALLRIPCVPSPADLAWRPDDVVVLATKTHQAEPALDDLARAAPASVTVVCATNGLEAERLALRRVESVVAMVVMLPTTHMRPGEVIAWSTPTTGLLDVGRYPTGQDDEVARIAGDLSSATFLSDPVPDAMRRKRRKLLMNLANVLEAACGPASRASELVERARDEALAVFAAAGDEVTTADEDAARRGSHLQMRPVGGERHQGGSTWQSLARGNDLEGDYLNGEVVLLGRLHGVPTPVNAMLQRLGLDLAQHGTAPGSLTLEQVEARLAGA